MEVRVNSQRCTGCGMCVIICPELFFLECRNPHPVAVARRKRLAGERGLLARNAAMHCPSSSIVLEQELGSKSTLQAAR